MQAEHPYQVDPIICAMLIHNFIPNPTGICLGYSFHALQAFLLNDKSFKENLILLNQLYHALMMEISSDFNIEIAELNNLDEKNKKKVGNLIKEKMASKLHELSIKDQKSIYDLVKNIDTVYANHSKKTTKKFTLIKPENLSEANSIKQIGFVYSRYSFQELSERLQAIAILLKDSKHRVGFFLSNSSIKVNHVIGLGFEPIAQCWTLFDTNSNPLLSHSNTDEIVKYIIGSLSKEEITEDVIIETLTAKIAIEIICQSGNHSPLNTAISQWINEIELKKVKLDALATISQLYLENKTPLFERANFDTYIQKIFTQFDTQINSNDLKKIINSKIAYFFDKEAFLYQQHLLAALTEILDSLPRFTRWYDGLKYKIDYLHNRHLNLEQLHEEVNQVRRWIKNYEKNFFNQVILFFNKGLSSSYADKINQMFDDENNLTMHSESVENQPKDLSSKAIS